MVGEHGEVLVLDRGITKVTGRRDKTDFQSEMVLTARSVCASAVNTISLSSARWPRQAAAQVSEAPSGTPQLQQRKELLDGPDVDPQLIGARDLRLGA